MTFFAFAGIFLIGHGIATASQRSHAQQSRCVCQLLSLSLLDLFLFGLLFLRLFLFGLLFLRLFLFGLLFFCLLLFYLLFILLLLLKSRNYQICFILTVVLIGLQHPDNFLFLFGLNAFLPYKRNRQSSFQFCDLGYDFFRLNTVCESKFHCSVFNLIFRDR